MNANRNDKGVLLVLAVVVMLVVAGLVTTLLTVTLSSARRERQSSALLQAREVAETGVDLALNELRKASDGVDNDSDGEVDEGIWAVDLFAPQTVLLLEGNLGRVGSLAWSPANDLDGNGLPDFGELGVEPLAVSGGDVFTTTIFSERDGIDGDGDGKVDEADEAGTVTVISWGRARGMESRVVYRGIFTELLPRPEDPPWSPDVAIASGGNLLVTGSAQVSGVEGSLHANGHLDMTGAAIVSQDVTACVGCAVSDTGSVGGVIDGASPAIPIPNVDPEAFRPDADFVLRSDGTILGGDGQPVAFAQSYRGWRFSGGRWTYSGTQDRQGGTYFVEGSAIVSGSASGTPNLSVTIVTTGDVSLTGNGVFRPALHPFFLVAGGDISIHGTPDQVIQGIVLAREQVEVIGNPVLEGVIMAADLDDARSLVTETRINGNMTIHYDGGLGTEIPVVPPVKRFVLDPTFASFQEQSRATNTTGTAP